MSSLPLTVYTRDGKLIAQIGEQRRIPVKREQVPQVVVDAFLASEDDRFFQHPGVDWQGLVRALATNVSARGLRAAHAQKFLRRGIQIGESALDVGGDDGFGQ